MQTFVVTEVEYDIRDNPDAHQGPEFLLAMWRLGAPSFADALRVVAQTTGLCWKRDLFLAHGPDDVVGLEAYGSRWRDADGCKVDQVFQWRIDRAG